MKRSFLFASISGFALLALACSSSTGTATPADGADGGSSGTSGTSGSGGMTPVKGAIFTIVLENHDYAEIVGSPDAPYINQLIASYGLATNYQDSGTHPSLPNYLTMISGEPQYGGGLDLNPDTSPFPVTAPNLGSQLEAAKITWRSYQESSGTPCNMAVTSPYAPKHDPFLYFTDMQVSELCAARNVDYGTFAADLAAGATRFMWITPNLTSDGHDPDKDPVTGLKHSDAWVATEIPKIMASAVYKNGGVIFLTWDEAEGRSGANSMDQIPMIVISENIKSAGYKSAKAYSHKSYLATVEDLLGMPRLATVANEPSMTEFLK